MLPATYVPAASVTAPPRAGIPAALALALLEAVRTVDVPVPDGLDEPHGDLAAKRLGLSRTVENEITRLARLAARGAAVPGQEFAALQRLVARRPDAALVFSEAGRRAARRAVASLPIRSRLVLRTLPRAAAHAVGFLLARRLARRQFGADLVQGEGVPRASLGGDLAVVTEAGPACSFIGSALAELLRRVAGFDGAMVHTTCRARGADVCAWSAAPAAPRNGDAR
jgi:hypothetical protein